MDGCLCQTLSLKTVLDSATKLKPVSTQQVYLDENGKDE